MSALNIATFKPGMIIFCIIMADLAPICSFTRVSGFGNFNVRRKVARPGRNPKTGEPKEISERTVVTFHPTKKLLLRLAR